MKRKISAILLALCMAGSACAATPKNGHVPMPDADAGRPGVLDVNPAIDEHPPVTAFDDVDQAPISAAQLSISWLPAETLGLTLSLLIGGTTAGMRGLGALNLLDPVNGRGMELSDPGNLALDAQHLPEAWPWPASGRLLARKQQARWHGFGRNHPCHRQLQGNRSVGRWHKPMSHRACTHGRSIRQHDIRSRFQSRLDGRHRARGRSRHWHPQQAQRTRQYRPRLHALRRR
ncbi:hypothetical protein [Dyella acidiphila]|uniref:Lipoprotein n=1 Tax=Dyella acidiphila TaxID=2775866 RepID=A0ABR9G640_9GAMM|nr:hypothetical protein [Dyella acidiphila]MBE1159474.1 hypothetical protein [Dyella acidiphila]